MLVHSLFPPPGMLGELTWLYWGPVGRVWGIPVCPGPGAITGGLGLRPWGPIPIPMPPPPPIIGWRGTLVVGSGGRKDCTSEIRLRTYHTHCTDGGIYAAHELEHSHNMGQNNFHSGVLMLQLSINSLGSRTSCAKKPITALVSQLYNFH